MKIQALDMHVCENDGTKWAVTMAWNAEADVFGVSWHKMLSDFEMLGNGRFDPPIFEDVPFVTSDLLPGCIQNTVQVLVRGDSQKPRGIQLCGVSRFPISPNSKTLLGYLDTVKKFPGFECVGDLFKSLGRDEDFLEGIPIHTDIIMTKL